MRNAIITEFENRMHLGRKTHPDFRPGDTVRVHFKIEESSKGGKEKKYRIQALKVFVSATKKEQLHQASLFVKSVPTALVLEKSFQPKISSDRQDRNHLWWSC